MLRVTEASVIAWECDFGDDADVRLHRGREHEQEYKSSALTVDVDSFMLAFESKIDDVRAANLQRLTKSRRCVPLSVCLL